VPTPEMAQALRIKNSDQVYKILRLMCFDDIPVALEHVHLPVNMFENMEVSELEFSKYLHRKYHWKKVQRREQNLTAINITDDFVINCLKLEKIMLLWRFTKLSILMMAPHASHHRHY
jgi:GntR family mannosyl-D-glycerate transport/metabolism transcriptional repressor